MLGDFNARVGKEHSSWEGVLGRHGVGKVNDNGQLLLSKCAKHSLCISNTLFRLADKYKTTWMYPRSKHWHMIVFIIVRQRDIRDVRVTRAMRGVECWTDHRLVRAVLTLHIDPPHRNRPKTVRASYNVTGLKNPIRLAQFQEALDETLQDGLTSETSSEKWSSFKDTVAETAKEVLGAETRTHEDWFDGNDGKIREALYAKNKSYIEWQNDPSSVSKCERFKTLQAKVQSDLRLMEDQLWQDKAAEVQYYADTHNSKKFFSSLKTTFGPSASSFCPLLASDCSTLIKDQEGMSKRWQEHFSDLLNRPLSVDTGALSQISQQPIQDSLAEPPTMDKIKKAIHQTSSSRASGKDGIPAEIYKAAGPNALEAFHDVLLSIWEEEKMTDDFCDALIVSLFKNKGSKSDCGNYRGISLLSIAGKIFARVILNRLITVSEQNLPEAQCGFGPGKSTVDMIFAMRQLQEKCIEQNMRLFFVFIDLTKAFDTVNREALWTVLKHIGCSPKFLSMIRLFHDDMTGQVLSNGNVTEAFAISNGVKQGCVLAPIAFNIFFTCMLSHTVRHLEKGVCICYPLDGSFFDLHCLATKAKSLQSLLQEVLFADDCALVAHTESDLQLMQDRFSSASKLFGLTVSLGKTKVPHQPAPNTHPPASNTVIDDTPLGNVDHFIYLGSTISCDGSLDKKIATRISKASQALGRLRNRVLNQHNIRLLTKLKSTMLWFSPPSFTVVKLGHCIVDTSRSWSLSTCELFVPY